MSLKLVQNQQKRGAARGSSKRRSRRQGGNSVGTYFGDAWSLAKRTAVGLNEIRKLINVEQKYSETSVNTTFNSSGNVTYLSGISQGDDTINREGNSIKMQAIRLRYNLIHNSANSAGCTFRVMIVRDLQNQGATITMNDVLESVGSATAPLAFTDFVNGPLQNKRFSIVYDQFGTLDIYNPTYSDSFVSTHDCHVYFRGGGATVASAGNGAYFLLVMSSETTNLPTVIANTRHEFTDN